MTTRKDTRILTSIFPLCTCHALVLLHYSRLAWNYPYLSSLNGVLPSIIAGNSVILKHSSQTPLCGERFGQAWTEAGLPDGVFQVKATYAFFLSF